jgi:dihydrofolate reductase
VTRSLDGCIEDEQGKIDWTAPDEERQLFVNDAMRPVGTHLYGRRMYETMQVWRQFGSSESDLSWARDFARMWRAADKVVYSKTLTQVAMPRTRLEQTFDVDDIREMKLRAAHDL